MRDREKTGGENPEMEEKLSVLLHSLRASRRRHVIALLDEQKAEESVSTRWLARQIAGRENGTSPDRVSSEQYKNMYNALSQSHLPTLTDADVIVYDPQRQMVQRGQSFSLAILLLNLNRPTVRAFYDPCR
jgi:hypothetical protein